MAEDVFEAPAAVSHIGDGLQICTPYGTIRFFGNGWEVERGSTEDCEGEVALIKVKEVKDGVVVKYVNSRIYAAALRREDWPEVVVASSDLELPEWARF